MCTLLADWALNLELPNKLAPKDGCKCCAAALVTHQNETRRHPAAFRRRCRFPSSPLPRHRATPRLNKKSRHIHWILERQKPAPQRTRQKKETNTKQDTAAIVYHTLRLVALAPGAVGGGSNLCSPVDAGDVAAQGSGEYTARVERWGGSAYVIMTVKLKESAMARPACMPSRPYLQTRQRQKFGGKQTHVCGSQCLPLLYAQNCRDWDSDGPIREDVGYCSHHLLSAGAENARAHPAHGV